ncbi:MAG: alpha/beta hydrolase [Chitinophagaceae bacterium]|nr:MAG: alpha/beta hydrolase [Chitinophagaceae bacterium]
MKKGKAGKVIRIILLFIVLYALAGLLLYQYQASIILRGTRLPSNYTFHFDYPFREFNLPLTNTDRLNMVLFEADSAKGMVVYFHGNTDNLVDFAKYAPIFLKQGYDVLMMDYPGYGKSTGPNTERDLYNDALISYQLARSYFSADSIILYGKSLGTAMASHVASLHPCKMLILECPLYNFDMLAKRYFRIYPVSMLLHYHFPVYRFIRHTFSPIVIFHGRKDRVIPYRQSEKLKPYLKKGDEYITLPDGHHNDLYSQPLYQHVMDSLLDR